MTLDNPPPPPVTPDERILVIDFGSQVTQLIARRIREAGVFCEIVPYNGIGERLDAPGLKGIVTSGGPGSVTEDEPALPPERIYAMGLPILGICYGQQAMAHQLGGTVKRGRHEGGGGEFGRVDMEVVAETPFFQALATPGKAETVWMSHGDFVDEMPPGFRVIGRSDNAPLAAFVDEERRFYGVQFHPEVSHTPNGAKLLENFVRNVCGCRGTWTMAAYRSEAVRAIREQVGTEGKVICGLSGGVDSAVAAVLIHEAIGERLTCVFVDHGLLRHGEAEEVVRLFRDHYNIPLQAEDAKELFLSELHGIEDPEAKRKTIGRLFIDVFEKVAKSLGGADFLAQGTLYPDVIESVSATGGPSVTIKSHHNVGGLPERMNMQLVEPLRALFKDEVRALGRELGLPGQFVNRHPFPGPGLAIRIPGAIDEDSLDTLRHADRIYLDAIREADLYDEIWQAFAVLLPVRSVGVMGDERTYEKVVALRAVTSTDGMTADYYPYTHEFLGRVANRIVNEVRGVNRVVYDITSKPPGTIEWE